MASHLRLIIYKPGRPLFGKQVKGLKTNDPQTLAPTYTDNLTTDDYGTEVDPRFGQFDVNLRTR